MAEFLFELYSEEIPTNLQISAREEIRQRLNKSLEDCYELAMGGTAVGTGINSTEGFAEAVAKQISI